MAITTTEAQQLYIAYFGRPADPSGLSFWTQAGSTNNMQQQSNAFATAPEWTSAIAGMTNDQIVNLIYINSFGHAPDAAGLRFWSDAITNGVLSVGDAAWQIVTNTGPADAAIVAAKVEAALGYTAAVAADTTDSLAYGNSAAFASANTWLDTITTEAQAAAALVPATLSASLDSMVAASNAALGTTYTLTTGVNNFTGTDYDDTFNAALDGTSNTLNAQDRLNGVEGTDTLNAIVTASVTPISLQNIEVINITATAAATVGLINAGQATEVTNSGSTAALTVTGLAAAATNLYVYDTSSNSSFGYISTAGTQTVNLALDNVTGGELRLVGIENINITSGDGTTQANTLGALITDGAATTLTVAGYADLRITQALVTNNAAITSVDASAFTGDLDITTGALGNSATTVSVLGGTGDDSLNVSAIVNVVSVNAGAGDDTVTVANINSLDYVDGGTGNDTLAISGDAGQIAPGDAASVSNFETLNLIPGAGNTITQDMDAFSGITITEINAIGAAATVAFTDVGADVATLGSVGAITTVSAARKADTSADNLAVNLGSATAGTTIIDLTLNNEKTISITSQGGANTITNLNTSDLVTLNVAGAQNAALGTIVGATVLATVDASSSTGTVSFNGAASLANMTVTAGSGALTATTGTGNDSITGGVRGDNLTAGAGNDTILAADGNDTIDGGVGNDSILGGAGNDSITAGTGNDYIHGGAGEDSLVAGAGSDSIDGGADNDSINMAANWTTGDTVDGGTGAADTLLATVSSSITPANLSNVEILTLEMNGGAINASNISGVTTLNLRQSGATVFTNLANTVATINQITGSSTAASYGYATGAAATVLYDFDSTSANVTNGTTAIVNAAAITIDGDADNNVDLGTSFTAATATTITVSGDAAALDVGATINAGSATAITVTGAAGAVTFGDTAFNAAALVNYNVTGTSSGAVNVGVTNVGTALKTVNLTAATGEMNVGNITSDGAAVLTSYAINYGVNTGANDFGSIHVGSVSTGSIGTYSVTAGASTQANTYGAVIAGSVNAMNVTTGNGGGSHTFADMSAIGSIGSLTIDADDNVTFTTGATGTTSVGSINVDVLAGAMVILGTFGAVGGTIGNITVTGAGHFEMKSGEVLTIGTVDTSAMIGGTSNIALNNDTFVGTSMIGGDAEDDFRGTGANDTLTGAAGNDTLAGGAGADSIDGGMGTNTYAASNIVGQTEAASTGASVGQVINLSVSSLSALAIKSAMGSAYITANDSLSVASGTASYLYAIGNQNAANSTVTDTLANIVNVRGSYGTDYIVGSSSANVITSNGGNDVLTGGAGNDTFAITVNGTSSITDLALNNDAEIVTNSAASSVNAILAGNWTASAFTVNNAANTAFTVHADGTVSVDMSAAGTVNGYTVVNTGSGNVTGSAAADIINSSGNLTVIAGLDGIDQVNLTSGTQIVSFVGVNAAVNRDLVSGFVLTGSIVNRLGLDTDYTTAATAVGSSAVLENEAAAASNANGVAYDLESLVSLTTSTLDLVTLSSTVLANAANADLSISTDGTQLLKALVVAGAGHTASGITVTASSSFYLTTTENANGYLYLVNDFNANGLAAADEISLVGTFTATDIASVISMNTIMVA